MSLDTSILCVWFFLTFVDALDSLYFSDLFSDNVSITGRLCTDF